MANFQPSVTRRLISDGMGVHIRRSGGIRLVSYGVLGGVEALFMKLLEKETEKFLGILLMTPL